MRLHLFAIIIMYRQLQTADRILHKQHPCFRVIKLPIVSQMPNNVHISGTLNIETRLKQMSDQIKAQVKSYFNLTVSDMSNCAKG